MRLTSMNTDKEEELVIIIQPDIQISYILLIILRKVDADMQNSCQIHTVIEPNCKENEMNMKELGWRH